MRVVAASLEPTSEYAALPAPSETTATSTWPWEVSRTLTSAVSWQGSSLVRCEVPMAEAKAIRHGSTATPQTSAQPLGDSRGTVSPGCDLETPLSDADSQANRSR